MANNRSAELLQFAHLQMASEAFLEVIGNEPALASSGDVIRVLELGNTHASRFTNVLAQQFVRDWSIEKHWTNSNTGFSATLFKSKASGEYTLSFRSTEFVDDANRDVMATGRLEIRDLGWAFGQIAAMERVYGEVKAIIGATTKFNLTGYSLGGHLATAFNILREEERQITNLPSPVIHTYTFNGAGTGGLKLGDTKLTNVIATFNDVLNNPNSGKWLRLPALQRQAIRSRAEQRVAELLAEQQRVNGLSGVDFAFGRKPELTIQATVQYQIAALVAGLDAIPSQGFSNPGVNNLPVAIKPAPMIFANMTEVFGADRGRPETIPAELQNLSFVAFSGLHYGQNPLGVYIEEQPIYRGDYLTTGPAAGGRVVSNQKLNDYADTHSLVLLVDSLSLMAAFSTLDPTLTQAQIETIFAAASHTRRNTQSGAQGKAEGDTLEKTLDALRRLVLGAGAGTMPSSLEGNTWHLVDEFREPFHQNISGLLADTRFKDRIGRAKIEVRPWDEVLAQARVPGEAGLAWRYALSELNAFAITGDSTLYAQHNAAGALEIYNPTSQPHGQLTHAYLEDRALFLKWKNVRNRADVQGVVRQAGIRVPAEHVDLETGYSVTVRGLNDASSVASTKVAFGSDADERGVKAIGGGPLADRLYGGGGDDQLSGGLGNDYLEGGAGADALDGGIGNDVLVGGPGNDVLNGGKGLDTYIVGQGRDTIVDEDGRGLVMNASGDRVAGVFLKHGAQYVFADDPKIVATKNSPLTITLADGASVVIEDFDEGDFGIRLSDAALGPVPGKIFDLGAADDTLFVMWGERALVRGYAGNDFIRTATPAGVVIEGGVGGDLASGHDGNDELFGGGRSDLQALREGRVPSGSEPEAVYGGGGDDLVVGGAGNDWLGGGKGNDTIHGGPGDDLIAGGGDMYTTSYWATPQPPGARRPFVQETLTFNFDMGGEITREQGAFYESSGRVIRGEVPALRIFDDRDGADLIFAGAGNDEVWAGWDGDYVDGEAGNDLVYGEEGDDIVFGGDGDDTVFGDGDTDLVLPANHGADYIDGEAGNDKLYGWGGGDTLLGGEGDDTLVGDEESLDPAFLGDDYLDGEEGKDLIAGQGGDDELFGGEGDDELQGGEGYDHLDGEGDNDVLFGESGEDELYGGDGADDLMGGAGADDLDGEAGADRLFGEADDDTLRGGDGDDVLDAGGGNDALEGDGGSDQLVGREGNDVLAGGPGTDTLIGGAGNDIYVLSIGDGADAIQDLEGTNRIRFANAFSVAEFNVFQGASASDVVIEYGIAGDILTLTGGLTGAVQEFEFGDGAVLTHAQFLDQLPQMQISGTANADTLYSQYAGAHMNGGAGNDGIIGSDRGDTLLGGLGNDHLHGRAGADLLDGGPGLDTLAGGSGNDVYLFGFGSGRDEISPDWENTRAIDEVDAVVLADDILPDSVTVALDAATASPVLKLANSVDELVFYNWYSESTPADFAEPTGSTTVNEIRFEGATVWDVNAIAAMLNTATSGDDWLRGIAKDDVLHGLSGDDQILGNVGDDVLYGDAGLDFLTGGRGSDVLVGGADTDYLSGDRESDVLDGGGGDDALDGGAGDDIYVFGRGSGIDTIGTNESLGYETLALGAGVKPEDIAVSVHGYRQIQLGIRGTADKVLIDAGTELDSPMIDEVVFESGARWTSSDIKQRIFATAGTADSDTIYGTAANESINAAGGNDTVYAGAGDDIIEGGPNADRLYGGPGGDTYLFARGFGFDSINDANRGAGEGLNTIKFTNGITPTDVSLTRSGFGLEIAIGDSSDRASISGWFDQDDYRGTLQFVFADGNVVWDADTIARRAVSIQPGSYWGTPEADVLASGDQGGWIYAVAGDDAVNGGAATDRLYGGTGNDTLKGGGGNDFLYGNAGNDTFDGGPGNDLMDGGEGDDTYRFGQGAGRDRIVESYWYAGNMPGREIIQIDGDILPTDVSRSLIGGEHVLSLASGDSISVQGAGFRVQFASSPTTTWQLDSPIVGTPAADTLVATGFGAILDGRAGNDVLHHSTGATVVFGPGYGRDEVFVAGRGSVSFTEGVTPNHVRLSGIWSSPYGPATLKVTFTNSSDELHLLNWFNANAPEATLDRFQFANETSWDLTQISAHIQRTGTSAQDYLWGSSGADTLSAAAADDSLQGLAGNDILAGGDGGDHLFGGVGNDRLSGDGGDDTLDGGLGSDVIEGGVGNDNLTESEGNDHYVFSRGFGRDTLSARGRQTAQLGYDVIEFDTTIEPDDVVVTLESIDWSLGLKLAVNGTQDALTIADWSGPASRFIEEVRFATDKTVWTLADLVSKAARPSDAGELIEGTAFGDTFDGLAGDDRIDGYAGNDTLYGGAGDDRLSGDAGNDIVDGGQGSDRIYGAAGNDSLRGGPGADVLNGSVGNDSLDGGAGADQMLGGAGHDTYFVDDIRDSVSELGGAGVDTVRSAVTHALDADFENLVLIGTAAIDATGNALANALTGNNARNLLTGGAGNDALDGLGGADVLVGGLGNDTYTVDQAADSVREKPAEGDDIVLSPVSYTLPQNVENVTLIGTSAINTIGNALNNVLTGNSAANALDGRAGADTMSGGAGNDTYYVDNAVDRVTELAGQGTDTVQSVVGYTLGANVENLTLIGTLAIDGAGNTLDNVLNGNASTNRLSGGAGNDSYVVDNATDVVIEKPNEGTDEIYSYVTYALGANVENLTLQGSAAINGTGNALDNVLVGNSGINTLSGRAGNDTYVVYDTIDVIAEIANEGTDTVRSPVTYTLSPHVENLVLTGSAPIGGIGNDLNNMLTGNAAANRLSGRTGNDIYVLNSAADVAIENAAEGIDTVNVAFTYVLGANLENLTLTGAAQIAATGNNLDNVLRGNAANNVLDGAAGRDTMLGGAGDDVYLVDNAGDIVSENPTEGTDTVRTMVSYTLGLNVENLTLIGTLSINAIGNALDNVITGNTATNILAGRAGNDSYVVDSTADLISEKENEGSDTVRSSVTYTLGANLEKLVLTGAAAIAGTGNGLDNVLYGNSAANRLSGLAGNDTYVVQNTVDIVVEKPNEGTDIVQSSATYALSANVENLTLTGGVAIDGTGNELNNAINGNAAVNILAGGMGNDRLNGGGGNDRLSGGPGDDTFVLDAAGDVVVEASSEGTDTVEVAFTYTLGANLEKLILTGTSAINGTGNQLANVLRGNTAANRLNGGGGADALYGGSGNDIYVVDQTADAIIELNGEGTDTVESSVSYALGAFVENLTLTGNAVSGTGNTLANTITGNAATNALIGGVGNDVYVVDAAADVVTEKMNEGVDTVRSSATYTLSVNVEDLTLTGTAPINGTGNELNNAIAGNSAANQLAGGAGNDRLYGGGGADTLRGGRGDDAYIVDNTADVVVENPAEGVDRIASNVSYTLAAHVEQLTLTGSAALQGTGNAADNVITGNDGNNTLRGADGTDALIGGAGTDTLIGGRGDDTFYVDTGSDRVFENPNEGVDTVRAASTYELPSHVERLVLTGSGAIDGIGNDLDNALTGNIAANLLDGGAGNDRLEGGAGIDFMAGRGGDDTYVIDTSADIVSERVAEGTDTVLSPVSLTLYENVERLTLTGTASTSATGNAMNNLLTGNSAANVLDGAQGADTMAGGAGNDTYRVDALDVVTEKANEGADAIEVNFSYTLPANVEKLILLHGAQDGTGNELDNVIVGNQTVNVLNGAGGNDRLEGGDGVDTMAGGAGDDTYYIQDIWQYIYGIGSNGSYRFVVPGPRDRVAENANEGVDTVYTPVAYTLSDNVENLVLMEEGDSDWPYYPSIYNPSLSELEFILKRKAIGNSGNNVLTGSSRGDRLEGGAGNDTLRGRDGNDSLVGGEGNDTLDGGSGADWLTGGPGDDTYIAGGHVSESVNEGVDTVIAAYSYQLNDNVENLRLTGTAALDGSGNWGNNLLIGNDGDNVLDDHGGSNTMRGGAGNDLLKGNGALFGEAGNDVLQGWLDDDSLSESAGNNLLSGWSGSDTLTGGTGREVFIGGVGNDTIATGAGADIVAFNRGDGQDVVSAATGADNTLSIGGGIRYGDMTLTKNANNLVLNLGAGDQVTLKDWYAAPANKTVLNMQVIAEAMADFDAASADKLRNRKVVNFDFLGIASAYDAAGAPANWAMMNALLSKHLTGSDTAALGADIAYRYGRTGSLTGMGFDPVQGMLASASFATAAQTLQSSAVTDVGTRRLF